MSLVVKSADQIRSSNAALADDSELVIALSANTIYRVEGFVRWYSGTTPGFKYRWRYSSTIVWADINQNSATQPVDNSGFTGNGANMTQDCLAVDYLTADAGRAKPGNGTTTNRAHIWLTGFFRTDGAGNFSFQWCQNTSTASNTTVYGVSSLNLGSFLYIISVPDVGVN